MLPPDNGVFQRAQDSKSKMDAKYKALLRPAKVQYVIVFKDGGR